MFVKMSLKPLAMGLLSSVKYSNNGCGEEQCHCNIIHYAEDALNMKFNF